jgi:hypothetical protein
VVATKPLETLTTNGKPSEIGLEVNEVRVGGVMESGSNSTAEVRNGGFPNRGAPHVQVIVKAHEELRQLIRQRAEIVKRIGTIKQMIAGLCTMFGDAELSDDLREFVNHKAAVRRSGLTQTCRTVLMEAGCPVNSLEVCEQIQQRIAPPLPHKNLATSVIVVLNRLVQYGEARTTLRDDGRRTWGWVSDARDQSSHPAK